MPKNQLEWDEIEKLMAWARHERPNIDRDRLNRKQAAERATAALGFRVTEANIDTAAKKAGIPWPGRAKAEPKPGAATSDATVVGAILEISARIGGEPGPHVQALYARVAKDAAPLFPVAPPVGSP